MQGNCRWSANWGISSKERAKTLSVTHTNSKSLFVISCHYQHLQLRVDGLHWAQQQSVQESPLRGCNWPHSTEPHNAQVRCKSGHVSNERNIQVIIQVKFRIPSWELTHIPTQVTFEDDFPFPQLGYVSFLEGTSTSRIHIFKKKHAFEFGWSPLKGIWDSETRDLKYLMEGRDQHFLSNRKKTHTAIN